MSSYIHGSHPEEQERLKKLNALINARCLEILKMSKGEKVLDVGCGPGQFTLLMAEQVGAEGRCLGIERDKNQLKAAQQNLENADPGHIEFRQGNAENMELLHEEWGTFDLAHARFVLEHVQQPENVVQGMARALKEGGRAVVLDDDHAGLTLHPEPPGFNDLWQAYIRSYDRLGNDPYIGRRLVSLLYDSGLRDIRNGVVFFGDSGESPTFAAFATNLIEILNGAKDFLIRESLVAKPLFEETMGHLLAWASRPDAAMWYTIYWATGFKVQSPKSKVRSSQP